MTGVREVTELITAGPAEALAGLLGVPGLTDSGELPLLWHWVYLLDRPPQVALGTDGHPAHGGIPSPPAAGLRRMFAGGRVHRDGPLCAGTEATRRTWQAAAVRKQGRAGPLYFVTVTTEISQGGQVVLTEEQDLVYLEAAQANVSPDNAGSHAPPPHTQPSKPSSAGGPGWKVETDPVLLFRFSALTYNAHRIHYDLDYARSEGHPGLVVHGPLQALLMAEAARREVSQPVRCDYVYRLVAPLFDGQGLVVSAATDAEGTHLTARDFSGRTTGTGALR